MTTGIQLIQAVPARAASQILGAQLSPKSARIDAPESRDFIDALKHAHGRDELAKPVDRPGGEQRPADETKPDEHKKGDQTKGGPESTDGPDSVKDDKSGSDKAPDAKGKGDEPPSKPGVEQTPDDDVNDAIKKKHALAQDVPGVGPGPKDGPVTDRPGGVVPPNAADAATNTGAAPTSQGSQQGVAPQPVDPWVFQADGGAQASQGGQIPGDLSLGVNPGSVDGAGVHGLTPGQGDGRVPQLSPTPVPPSGKAARARFDEAVRAQIKHAAHIDLGELAAEELTSPKASPWDPAAPRQGVVASELADAQVATRPTETTPADRAATHTAAQVTPPPDAQGTPRRDNAWAEAPAGDTRPVGAGAASRSAGEQGGGQTKQDAGAHTPTPTPTAAPVAGVRAAPIAEAASFRANLQNLQGVGDAKPAGRAPGLEPSVMKSRPGQQAPSETGEAAKRVLAQVSRGVASILRQKGGSLTLRLSPQSLGELRVSMRMEGGSVNASFKATEPQARDLLQNNLDSLKATLEQHGVRVERLSVEGEHEGTRDASHARAEDPRSRGEESRSRESPMDPGDDGRSPNDQGHGGRSGGDAGREPRANHISRRGAGGAPEITGDGAVAAGMNSSDAHLGLDTLA